MKHFINKIYQNNSLVYKAFLFVATTFLIVHLFPEGGKFKFEFQKGKPWQYENLYAPFDFAIQKSPEVIAREKELVKSQSKLFFACDLEIPLAVEKAMELRFQEFATDSVYFQKLRSQGKQILSKIYTRGFLEVGSATRANDAATLVFVRKGNEIKEIQFGDFFSVQRFV